MKDTIVIERGTDGRLSRLRFGAGAPASAAWPLLVESLAAVAPKAIREVVVESRSKHAAANAALQAAASARGIGVTVTT